MRQRFFGRYYILTLTFFGTENFSSRKIFKKYLHTYTKPFNTHYYRLLHHVCSLHKFGATNTKRGILMAFWRSLHVILLKLCLFRLTYPRRKKLFRMRKKFFIGETTRFDVSCDVEAPVKGFRAAWEQRWLRSKSVKWRNAFKNVGNLHRVTHRMLMRKHRLCRYVGCFQ